MIKKINSSENMSMSVWVDTVRLGEIIHWQKTGVIESWHYREQYATKKMFIDIAMFDEQHLEQAIQWAKYGQEWGCSKESAQETRTGCSFPNNDCDCAYNEVKKG